MDYRTISYKILYQFENNYRISDIKRNILSEFPRNSDLNEIVRFKGRLDLMIAYISGKKTRYLNKKLLTILRIGFYEIFFDSKVPNYAAVNSSVNIANKVTNKKTKGFANAVLRKLVRQNKKNATWYKELERKKGWLSIPSWMENRWMRNFGKKSVIKLVDFCNQPAKTFLRCDGSPSLMKKNISLLDKAGIDTELFSHQFLLVKSNDSKVLSSKPFENGEISIQSPSAGAIVDCLGAEEGDIVLDVCAAPGTKTLQLENIVGINGMILASDISQERLSLGQKDEKRHKKSNIEWSLKDARKDSFKMADKILIDAPCSGTGVIGRKPEIRWRRRERDLKKFADTQFSILKNCSKYLKVGGFLVYATCSIEPEENLMVVEHFLNYNSNFAIDNIPDKVNKLWVKNSIALNILPQEHGLDGIFAMRMKRIF